MQLVLDVENVKVEGNGKFGEVRATILVDADDLVSEIYNSGNMDRFKKALKEFEEQ